MKTLAAAVALAAAGATPLAHAADAASAPAMTAPGMAASMPGGKSSLAHADTSFMKDAAHAGSAEIESAQLAASKSADPRVKAFAQQMVTDHTAAAEELKTLATAKGYELPAGPTMTQKAKDKMLGMRDSSFDRSYAKMAVSDHEKAVALFKKASTGAKDADVRAFASKTLPTLEHHLQMAKELQTSTGAKSN